jgi:hypothetical protein
MPPAVMSIQHSPVAIRAFGAVDSTMPRKKQHGGSGNA